jgi:hypothetical protein
MNWTGADDLRAQLQKLWDSGELLSAMVRGDASFPRRLQLKAPTSGELTEQFDAARSWISELRALPSFRIVMREFKHRVFGANELPSEAWVDSLDEALALLGRQRAAARFMELVELTRAEQPLLLAWVARRPLRALELALQWPQLLAVVAWLQAHPRPGLYLRQLDIAGVHSKFIEAQRGVLTELLDLALPPAAIDASASGVGQFVQRYGFRDKPLRVRLRPLDMALALRLGGLDVTLDAASFAALNLDVRSVFITENEINFLSFPAVPGALVIFGAGYGFDMLSTAAWLAHCRLQYWGDIDTHGFAILDQLRAHFPHAESFLMDEATLQAFAPLWGEEDKPTLRELTRLRAPEQALYDALRGHRLRKNLRLEQEKIGFAWVEAGLAGLAAQPVARVG